MLATGKPPPRPTKWPFTPRRVSPQVLAAPPGAYGQHTNMLPFIAAVLY